MMRRSSAERPQGREHTVAVRVRALGGNLGLGAALLALVVLPFLLAGRTGNALWIAAPVLATLVYALLRELPRCLAYYRSLWPLAWRRALLTALAALNVTLGLGAALSRLPPGGPLDWSLGSLFDVGGAAGVNGFAIPLGTPLLALLYAPPALLALPLLAWWEEDIFRRGTRGLRSALIRSTLFGLLHITAGVSLGSCIALGAAGLVFSAAYAHALRDPSALEQRAALPASVRALLLPRASGARAREDFAVFRATQAHLIYNVVALLAILLTSL